MQLLFWSLFAADRDPCAGEPTWLWMQRWHLWKSASYGVLRSSGSEDYKHKKASGIFFFSLQCCDEGKKCRIHHYLWFEVSCGSMHCQENRETSCGPEGEEQRPGACPGPLAPQLAHGFWWATWTRGPRTGAGNPWLNRNLSWALPLGREGKSFFLWSSLRSILNPEVKQRANYINFLLISMEKFTMFLLFNFFKHYL